MDIPRSGALEQRVQEDSQGRIRKFESSVRPARPVRPFTLCPLSTEQKIQLGGNVVPKNLAHKCLILDMYKWFISQMW
jgi:hypothetical protein